MCRAASTGRARLRASSSASRTQVERFAPGFRDRILARHMLTPPDFAARNPNLVEGDVGGGSTALDQLIFRPVPSLSPYRTPIARPLHRQRRDLPRPRRPRHRRGCRRPLRPARHPLPPPHAVTISRPRNCRLATSLHGERTFARPLFAFRPAIHYYPDVGTRHNVVRCAFRRDRTRDGGNDGSSE